MTQDRSGSHWRIVKQERPIIASRVLRLVPQLLASLPRLLWDANATEPIGMEEECH